MSDINLVEAAVELGRKKSQMHEELVKVLTKFYTETGFLVNKVDIIISKKDRKSY